ncbi:hypothetical protein [Mesorhizobium ciceri]|uniref:hypothetical protein n=1 Tax=Mesorhizobium TaxID=68287 RepID=UPI0012DC9FC4|nr:hypothetical protein [Mesorhizobium ciceri]
MRAIHRAAQRYFIILCELFRQAGEREKCTDLLQAHSCRIMVVLHNLDYRVCLAMALAWTAARRMLWGEANDATKSKALSLSRRAANVIVVAGFIFVFGLVLTILAGFITMLDGAATPR